MLQSIQYIGSGPPTYVYSKKATGAGYEFYHVFATETRGYDGRKEEKDRKSKFFKKESVTVKPAVSDLRLDLQGNIQLDRIFHLALENLKHRGGILPR